MTPTLGLDPARLKTLYEIDAEQYVRSLPLEHFMESTAQATQRQITVESFELVRLHRPDIQTFSELLIQYPVPGQHRTRPARVVPDNMVVVHPALLDVGGSFMTPLQPVGPLLVLEYVSKSNPRKDYDGNYRRYEQDLKVPYYLLFYPDADELTLFRLGGRGYESVRPNAAGRLPVPELELETALLDGWVRYWFRGELLPLPGELLGQLNGVRSELVAERAARQTAERERDAERQARLAAEAELARLREELARAKGARP